MQAIKNIATRLLLLRRPAVSAPSPSALALRAQLYATALRPWETDPTVELSADVVAQFRKLVGVR